MEIEYKWELPDEESLAKLIDEIATGCTGEPRRIRMQATYYDTPGADVAKVHGGLRIRKENDDSVCCLKLSAASADGCKSREEFEVDATDIVEGLSKLPGTGAPKELCDKLLIAGPQPTCHTDFDRTAYGFEPPTFSAEIAIDRGKLGNHNGSAPIHEMELEYKGGSIEDFHAFANRIQNEYGLEVQHMSKLARAMSL